MNLVTAASISACVLIFHSPFTCLLISDLYLCQSVRELWSLGGRFYGRESSGGGDFDRGVV